jgi:hypothetical protein
VACYEGRAIGEENDIRVFDVQHIKGLEFEAVFFVGIDELVTQRPELFDKYLYVGDPRRDVPGFDMRRRVTASENPGAEFELL